MTPIHSTAQKNAQALASHQTVFPPAANRVGCQSGHCACSASSVHQEDNKTSGRCGCAEQEPERWDGLE